MNRQPTKANLNDVVALTAREVGLVVAPETVATRKVLLQLLTRAVQQLMDTNFEGLMQVLYRIDVDENRVKAAFGLQQDVAQQIALLILEREEQKVITRAAYKRR